MSDSEFEYQIQSPHRIAKRALALSAYCCRGFIDNGQDDASAQSLHERIIRWVAKLKLTEQLGDFESKAIDSPLGSLDSSRKYCMTWEVEGLAVLAWAMGRGPMPLHDSQVNPYDVTDSVYFLADDAFEVLTSAPLRNAVELRAYRELMYAIHCRIRGFQRDGVKKDFTHWIEPGWLEVLNLDASRFIVEGDLALGGKTISTVDEKLVKTCESGIAQQHRAGIWLISEEQNHWETPADT